MTYYFEQLRHPSTLYKYRSFNSERDLRLLSHNELFFASPLRFNDPFDSKIPIIFESDSRDVVVNYWTEEMRILEPSWSESRRRERIEELYLRGALSGQDFANRAGLQTEKIAPTLFGVCSLAGSASNILLWAHYAESHSGFAVGFNRLNVQRTCSLSTSVNKRPMILLPVQYAKRFPRINGYRNSREERFRMQQLTKAEDWEYEKEYRILLQWGADNTVTFPIQVFKRVLLGCQITTENRSRIIGILRARGDHLPLFQAQRAKSSFAIEFSIVKY